MPYAVDESRLRDTIPGQANPSGETVLVRLDPHKPPVKPIPHMEFPRVVYKHPNEPFTTTEHRNARHELVDEEIIPSEHLSKVVACEAHLQSAGVQGICRDCQKALKEALEEGWVLEPYKQETPPDRKAGLYDKRK